MLLMDIILFFYLFNNRLPIESAIFGLFFHLSKLHLLISCQTEGCFVFHIF